MRYVLMKHLLIIFEGLDGVGKTTAAKGFTKEIGATYFSFKDHVPFLFFKGIVNRMPLWVRFFYYRYLFLVAHRKARKLLKEGSVCMDRSLLFVMTYLVAYGLPRFYLRFIPKSFFGEIDYVVYLRLPFSERKRRLDLKIREGETVTVNDIQSLKLGDKIEDEYLGLCPEKMLVINVEHKDPGSIIKEIKSILEM